MSDTIDLSQLLVSDKLTQAKLGDGTGVILDLDRLRVLALNETALFLVEQLRSGCTTRSQLVNRLHASFEVGEEDAEQDVDDFINELAALLLESRSGS
jgi:hypothetical protein